MADWIEMIYLFLKYGADPTVELGPLGKGLRYVAVRASVKSEQGLHVKAARAQAIEIMAVLHESRGGKHFK